MSDVKKCPQCGAELPADAPAGICPKCLLAAGLVSDTAIREERSDDAPTTPLPSSSRFVPPSAQELARNFSQLEILELIGAGGMGAVYKARQPGLDRLVAVKILPPEVGADPAFAQRFMREAKSLARLGHQHIVSVYDFGVAGGLYYFIMEYVDGANLRHLIKTGELQPAEALAIVPQICEALQFAHDEGVVHRDIKPENILIDKRGRVKIADFGLARLLGRAAPEVSLTCTNQVLGTLHYMAPEQLKGAANVDHRADIYSLGVVFYELLTGDVPMGRFQPPSAKVQVDIRVDDVVLKSLEHEPERRYQHASEVKCDVESISTGHRASAEAESGVAAIPISKSSSASQVRFSESETAPAGSTAALLGQYAPDIVVYAASIVLIGLLWRIRSWTVINFVFFAVAAAAISLFQWRTLKTASLSRQVSDSFGIFAIAVVAAWAVKWSALAGAASSLAGKHAAIFAMVLFDLMFLGGLAIAPLWRHFVIERTSGGNGEGRSPLLRLPLLTFGVLYLAGGLGMLFNQFLIVVDSASWHPHAVSAADFENKYADDLQRLVLPLAAEEREPPPVSLVFDQEINFLANTHVVTGFQPGRWEITDWLILAFQGFLALWLLGLGLDASSNRSLSNFKPWSRAILGVALPYCAVLVVFALYSLLVQAPLRDEFRNEGLYVTLRLTGPPSKISDKIGARLDRMGFMPDANWGYRLNSADAADPIAEFRYGLFEPQNWFDRFGFSMFGGIVREKPLILVTQLSGMKSHENVITIDARSRRRGLNEELWEELVNELKSALVETARTKG